MNKLKVKNKKLKVRGFTLIELMVASTIFIIVMVIAISSVLNIINVNRKAQSLNSIMTNLSFALESMVRDVREGSGYCATGSYGCPSAVNTSSISFTNYLSQQVIYSYCGPNTSSVYCPQSQANGYISKSINGAAASVITAPEVNITNMLFSIRGNGSSDGQQPIILLIIQGKTGASLKTQSTFQVETLITQRLLDS
ncbi:MAG TPA: prepilin-type N-terminal cleavage/methylation domain-containing protein [Candidatus Paceibacterota bacterium]|nr:prepilin-type N-terminal cleavage/methylation domain-containing protein [Candidatus Paceibacterota bacterium]